MTLVIVGGIFMAAHLPARPPLGPAVALLAATGTVAASTQKASHASASQYNIGRLHSVARLTQRVPWLCGPASRRVCYFVVGPVVRRLSRHQAQMRKGPSDLPFAAVGGPRGG